ncbi:hypothetical protein V8C44DRAFT_353002 [Trichoderma aethiopicum]
MRLGPILLVTTLHQHPPICEFGAKVASSATICAISYRRTGSRKRRFDSGTSRLRSDFGQAGWIVWLQPTKTCSSAAAKCNPSFCLSALLGSDTAMAVVQIYGCDHGRQLCRKVPACGEPRSRPAKKFPKLSSQPSSWALQNRYCKRRRRR